MRRAPLPGITRKSDESAEGGIGHGGPRGRVKRYWLTPVADKDLDEIADFIADDDPRFRRACRNRSIR